MVSNENIWNWFLPWFQMRKFEIDSYHGFKWEFLKLIFAMVSNDNILKIDSCHGFKWEYLKLILAMVSMKISKNDSSEFLLILKLFFAMVSNDDI